MKISCFLLLLLILAQCGLFQQYAKREVLWAYPGGYDQSAYLTTDDLLYRDILQSGLSTAVGGYLRRASATGLMLPLQDALLHLFLGPGRMSDLWLNLGYFVLLEIAVFLTARWFSGRESFGWLACGLLLMQQTAFLPFGGVFDCRIDLIVYSLYGIIVCCLLRSDGMREKRWIAAAAGVAMLLLTFRFITFAYLLGFCTTLFTGLFGLRLLWRGRRRERAFLGRAMRRTAALGGVLLAGGGLLVALNWQAIRNYYIVGHLTGSEKHLRAVEAGIFDRVGHLTYYARSLSQEHLGRAFLVVWLAAAAAGLALWYFGRARTRAAVGQWRRQDGKWLFEILVCASSIFAPWFILTLDESKSPVVAGVAAPPSILLLICLVNGLARRWRRGAGGEDAKSRLAPWIWRTAALAAVALGAANWLGQLTRPGQHTLHRASDEQINALYDLLADGAAQRGLDHPRLATDMMADWLFPSTMNVAVYERTGRWMDAQPSLGTSMFAISREEVFKQLAQADIVLTSTIPKDGTYPFYDSIRPLVPEIAAWCESHLVRARTFQIYNGEVVAYFRLGVSYEGLSGGWITPAGFRVRVPADVVDRMRANKLDTLVMDGTLNPDWLKGTPVARAQFVAGAPEAPCPVRFTLPQPTVYELRLSLGASLDRVPAGSAVTVEIHLDGAVFFPPDVGIDDPRQLIVTQPSGLHLE